MADLIDRTEAINRKEWSSDLKSYVVTVKELQRIPKVRTDADDQTDTMRFLFNRCYVAPSGMGYMCLFCGLRDKCESIRTVGKGDGDHDV